MATSNADDFCQLGVRTPAHPGLAVIGRVDVAVDGNRLRSEVGRKCKCLMPSASATWRRGRRIISTETQ